MVKLRYIDGRSKVYLLDKGRRTVPVEEGVEVMVTEKEVDGLLGERNGHLPCWEKVSTRKKKEEPVIIDETEVKDDGSR